MCPERALQSVSERFFEVTKGQVFRRPNITHAAKRIYGVSEFLYYAVADGLGRLFTRHGKWDGYKPPDPESNPLGLVFLE